MSGYVMLHQAMTDKFRIGVVIQVGHFRSR